MTALGLPDFGPVQNNISFNAKKGVTRGIHAEPWDKYISIAAGSVFGAWVDLRPGELVRPGVYDRVWTRARRSTCRVAWATASRRWRTVPCTRTLVNAHWSLEQKKTYTFVNLADPDLHIQWPIPLEESERSEADLHHPMLRDAKPMAPRRTLVTGCNGQLGHAIRAYAESAWSGGVRVQRTSTRSTSPIRPQYDQYDWSLYGTIINAGAYTAVDKAETAEGRAVGVEGERAGAGAAGACGRVSITSRWCT